MARQHHVLFTNECGQVSINCAPYLTAVDLNHKHKLGCNDVFIKFCNPLNTGTPTMRLQLHTGYAQGGGDIGASCCGIFIAGGISAEAPIGLIGSCLDLNSSKSALNDPSPELLFQTGATHYNWRIAAQETVDKGFEIASSTTVNDNAYTSSYTNRFIIKGDTGNVGIGTTDPSYPLEVSAGTGTTGLMVGGSAGQVELQGDGQVYGYQKLDVTSAGLQIKGYSDGGGAKTEQAKLWLTQAATGARGGEIRFYTDNGSAMYERARITKDGDARFFAASGDGMYWDHSTSSLGIGTSSPDYSLHVQDDFEANIKIETNNNGASNFAGLRLFKSRGTNALPTSVANGDIVSQISFYPRDASGWNNTARMYAKICGTVTATDTPTDLVFSTGTTGLSDILFIKSGGNVGIGDPTPAYRLEVKDGNATSTAIQAKNTTGSAAAIQIAATSNTYSAHGVGNSEAWLVDETGNALNIGPPSSKNTPIKFVQNGAVIGKWDAGGAFGIGAYGTNSLRANEFFISNYCSKAQIEGTGISTSSLQLIANSTTEYPVLGLSRSRGTTIGSHTLLANNDNLGGVTFFASDGSSGFTQGAGITARINNICPAVTIASNQTPVDLVFSINDGGTDCGVSNVGRFSHAGNFLVGCNLACGNGMISALEKSGVAVLEARATTDFENGQGGVIVTRAVDCNSTDWAIGCHTAFAHIFYTNAGDCLAACINSLGGLNVGLCLTTGTLVNAGTCVISPIVCGTSCLMSADCVMGLNVCMGAGWFRNGTSGTGLYNAANSLCFFSSSACEWTAKSVSTVSQIQFDACIAGPLEITAGYIYGDACGCKIGFLNCAHSWSLMVCPNCHVYNPCTICSNITCGITCAISPVICATTTMQVGGNDVLTTASSVGANFCSGTDINNRVVTANGDGGSLCGEANMTFNGSTLNITGSIVATGDITSTSDCTVKCNISPILGAIDIVSNLCGRLFIKDGREQVGVVAQEIEKTLPQVVFNNNDNNLKSVSYGNIVGVLIEAIKDQKKCIEDQSNRIERLEKIVQGR